MSISVLIATYGEESWAELALTRALPSAQHQGALEILLGHDSEGTIASARNGLAEQASGEWLCFLDADDELGQGFIPAMQRASERASRGGWPPRLLTPAVRQIRNGRPRGPFFFPACEFTTGNWLIIGTLVQREFFLELGGFHEFAHGLEDWNLWARCVRAGAEITKVPRAIYVAHYAPDSKHHQLSRDRPAYMKEYERAREDAWG